MKLASGRSEEQKVRLTEQIVRSVVMALNTEEQAVSVAIHDVKPEDWVEKVYKPEIAGDWDSLYKEPGYNPFE